MTTLHGSTCLFRRAEGCILPKGTIASARDPLTHPFYPIEPPQPCNVSIFVGGFTLTDLDSPLWIRVGGRLSRVSDQSDQRSDQRDMDSQIVPVQESTQFDTIVPPPPPPSQSVPQAIPFTLHSQIEVAPPPVTSPIPTSEDPHTRMDRLEQKLRQMRASDGVVTWEDFDGALVASLPAKFRMPEIERYTGIGCPRIHLRLYSTVMRAHGLDEAQMIIDRPSEKDQISMIMRSLQPRFARHLMGFPIRILDLWYRLCMGKKPLGGHRSGDVGAISSAGMRPPRHYQTVGQTSEFYYPPSPHVQYKTPTSASYTRPRAPHHHLCAEAITSVCSLGMPLSRAFQKLMEGGLLTPLAPKPVPPRFRLDLHCSYHQGPGHDTDHCNALRHAIQDLIDQGLVNLGQPSVTANPLPAHSTHAIDGVSLGPQAPTPFSLIPDEAPFQLTHPTPLIIGCQDTFVSFTLWPEDDDSEGREIQIVTRSGRIAQPPPPAVRPFEGATSHEEVRREDDEVLRQLQSTQARISIWSSLASSKTHRDALIRALSRSVETTTTREIDSYDDNRQGHLHCVFDDDLPPRVRPRVPSIYHSLVLTLNVAFSHCYSPWFCTLILVHLLDGRAYDSTKREVMGTLVIDFQIGPAIFSTLFQVLRIPISFNLLLGRPWIHRIQTLEIEDFHRDFVAMSFDQHSSTVVLDMMRGMTFLPGMGLGRRQQGPKQVYSAIDNDMTFGLGSIPRGRLPLHGPTG
ncbi:hypothetical protein AAG906_010383 [Vitis piasezkii]